MIRDTSWETMSASGLGTSFGEMLLEALKIEAGLEQQLNALVYDFCGLTKGEIAIIEESLLE